jgi:hypothetical protein
MCGVGNGHLPPTHCGRGAEITSAPYPLSWNAATATEGLHSLTAVTRDAAGHTATSAAVSVAVANASVSPEVVRYWRFDEGRGTTALHNSFRTFRASSAPGKSWLSLREA